MCVVPSAMCTLLRNLWSTKKDVCGDPIISRQCPNSALALAQGAREDDKIVGWVSPFLADSANFAGPEITLHLEYSYSVALR